MRIVKKFVWLLLTLGLLDLVVQTASPIALGLAACMVLLPLLCLPVNLYAAKKLKLAGKLPVNLLPCTAGEPVERRDADRKRERRHLAEGQADNENFSAKPVLRQNPFDRGICPLVRLLWFDWNPCRL